MTFKSPCDSEDYKVKIKVPMSMLSNVIIEGLNKRSWNFQMNFWLAF